MYPGKYATQHPDRRGHNLGMYRMQVHDARTAGMHWQIGKGGGYHYKWDGQCWRDTRDGSEFLAALSAHASTQAGTPLRF